MDTLLGSSEHKQENNPSIPLRTFCSHLDTRHAFANPRWYLWELLMTRAYQGRLAISDDMLVDTRALWKLNSDGFGMELLKELLLSKDGAGHRHVACSIRDLPSFSSILADLVVRQKDMVGFTASDNQRLKGLADEYTEATLMNTPAILDRILHTVEDQAVKADYLPFLVRLDEWRNDMAVYPWPTPKESFAQRLQGRISDIRKAGHAQFDPVYATVCEYLNKGEMGKCKEGANTRKQLGRNELTNAINVIADPTERKDCESIVAMEYVFFIPDGMQWRSVHSFADAAVGEVSRIASLDVRIVHHLMSQASTTIQPYIPEALRRDVVFENVWSHCARDDFESLCERMEKGGDPAVTVAEFHAELRQVILEALQKKSWHELLTAKHQSPSILAQTAGPMIGEIFGQVTNAPTGVGAFAGGVATVAIEENVPLLKEGIGRAWTGFWHRRKLKKCFPDLYGAIKHNRRD